MAEWESVGIMHYYHGLEKQHISTCNLYVKEIGGVGILAMGENKRLLKPCKCILNGEICNACTDYGDYFVLPNSLYKLVSKD